MGKKQNNKKQNNKTTQKNQDKNWIIQQEAWFGFGQPKSTAGNLIRFQPV